MDEKAIKESLRALMQRSGLTLTNLREHSELCGALNLAGPEALRACIVDCLAKLDGTREGLALRQAYALNAGNDVPGSLNSRRAAFAKQLGVSIDTVKRAERSAIDQLYLWMFPQKLPSPDVARSGGFTGPVEVELSDSGLATIFRTEGMEVVLGRRLAPDIEPYIVFWFDETLIDSDDQLLLFYIRPHDGSEESVLQFFIGSTPVLLNFELDSGPGLVRINFQGPARPSQVVWGEMPDPGNFTTEALEGFPTTAGATNGAWLGLLYNGSPTVSTCVVLRDFVAEWEEEDLGPDRVRSGQFASICRTKGSLEL